MNCTGAEPFLVSVDPEPDEAPCPVSTHPGQEFDYVLEGALKIRINDRDMILIEGDSVYLNVDTQTYSGRAVVLKSLYGQYLRRTVMSDE